MLSCNHSKDIVNQKKSGAATLLRRPDTMKGDFIMFEDKRFNRRIARRSRALGLRRPRKAAGKDTKPQSEVFDLFDMMQQPDAYLI